VERKLELCEEVMAVLGAVDPGQADWRGSLVYERNWPAMTLLQQQFTMGKINKKGFKKKVQNLIKQLQSAKRALEVEEEGSFEHSLADKIYKAIGSMEQMIQFSRK